MRRSMTAVLGAMALLTAAQASASEVSGRWRTAEDGGVVEIDDCGSGICGRLITSQRIAAEPTIRDAYNHDRTLRTRLIKGIALFEEMKGGPKVWRGRVYNPADGGTYSGAVTLVDADTLRLRGCIVFPLCQTQTWRRLR